MEKVDQKINKKK